MRTALLVSLGLIAATSAASADPSTRLRPGEGRRVVVDGVRRPGPAPVTYPNYIYLNRCTGGCNVSGGADDARTLTSGIITGNHVLSEFQNDSGAVGAAADANWNALVKCVQEVYSPFAVTVSDTLPTNGVTFTEALVAGDPTEVGLTTDILGVGEVLPDCSPQDNILSFSFANHEGGSGLTRTYDTCWTVAQETAHNFGLDHEFQFTDGTSACNDPMTYRMDCGGEKFFRNKPAACGEGVPRTCKCGGTQNSVNKLTKVLGVGVSIIPAPTITLIAPSAGPVTAGFTAHATAGSRRGVAKVEMWLNNHLWATAKGAAFGQSGQPNPSDYTVTAPAGVPDGVIDVVLKAYDDLDLETDSATVTVTKGAPCATAATCAMGQKCEAGKCFWDPPTGMLGDACTFNEFCVNGMCQDSDVGQFCTQSCVVNSSDACPPMYDCIATSDTGGVCLPSSSSGGGCCSVEHESSRSAWAHIGLGALALGLLIRPWRRRRSN